MATIQDPARTQAVRNWVNGEFLKYRRDPSAQPLQDEADLSSGWTLRMETSDGPAAEAETMVRLFFQTCMDTTFEDSGAHTLAFRLGDDQGHPEAFVVDATVDGISVTAGTPLGLLRGAVHILWTVANRQAPYVPLGRQEKKPAFDLRISNTMWSPSAQTLDDLDNQYADDYLRLMAFFGVTGVHLHLHFWDLVQSDVLPELTHSDFKQRVAQLTAWRDKLARFGIKAYVLYNTLWLPGTHPVFAAHPEVKGAKTGFVEEEGYVLCTHQEKTRAFFKEATHNLFSAVPGLGGIVALVGGEGFMHCFSRPIPPFEGLSNCTACAHEDPNPSVAALCNAVGQGLHAAQPDAHFLCWPYSAFWSGEDIHQLAWLDLLDETVTPTANFETGDRDPKTHALLFDYNLIETGPSKRFEAQANAMKARGRMHMAKIESATTPLMFSLPNVPVYPRWARRYDALKTHEVPGYIAHWRFYGFTGSLSEELLAHSVWDEAPAVDYLATFAERSFGVCNDAVLEGWARMGQAWDHLPYSALLVGARQFYQKGPMFLGPAHPLIFDAQKDYGLKRGFERVLGHKAEAYESLEDLGKFACPAYCSDLLWAGPLPAAEAEAQFKKALDTFADGLALFEEGLGTDLTHGALVERGLARVQKAHLHTTWNVARFYRARDTWLHHLGGMGQFEAGVTEMQAILEDEIQNAEHILDDLERDPRLGYGFTYTIVYDAQMVREKIEQCRFVKDTELPKLAHGLRFHLHGVHR